MTGTLLQAGFDKGLDEAKAKGWTMADMKKDWNRVFSYKTAEREDNR
jgi:hypothetical protein